MMLRRKNSQQPYVPRAAGHAPPHVDVANFDQVEKLVSDTVAEYGRLDYMFNNAAATATRGELRDVSLAPWHRAMDVNMFGIVHGTIAAYSVMIRQGFGHIVNTGSIAGLVSFPDKHSLRSLQGGSSESFHSPAGGSGRTGRKSHRRLSRPDSWRRA